MATGTDLYEQTQARFTALIERVLPESATLLVVSKGDSALLDIGVKEAWHFPQRSDGVYAGYHPIDSAAAIDHLEALRAKGADHLAIPAPSLWWLEHYEDFGRHLTETHSLLAEESGVGVVYRLTPPSRKRRRPPKRRSAPAATGESDGSADWMADALDLFEPKHYGEQVKRKFTSAEKALEDYKRRGERETASPHPLFDGAWFIQRYGEIEGLPPFLAYLKRGAAERQDPSPFFDSAYYYSQRPALEPAGTNPLVHYVKNRGVNHAAHPNPLFRGGFYTHYFPEATAEGRTPFDHYVTVGRHEGAHASEEHRSILSPLRRSAGSLKRGEWRRGSVLMVCDKPDRRGWPSFPEMATHLASDHHLDPIVISAVPPPEVEARKSAGATVVLEDYALACEIMRPAARRLLIASLSVLRPRFAVTDSVDAAETLASIEVPCFYLRPSRSRGSRASGSAQTMPKGIHVVDPPARAARGAGRFAEDLVGRVGERRGRPETRDKRSASGGGKVKVTIPCPDWSVSGVNAALETVGRHLLEKGWDVEVLFTRDEERVRATGGGSHMPEIPYRFLERPKPGVFGLWEALIADVESQGPCILLTGYDFLANGVIPALSSNVGVVSWVQADDGDYYEQAYRLGLYCNALVCVSQRIKDGVAALNPLVGERCHVIHNTSVSKGQVQRRRAHSRRTLRMVYSGRLVQYQKRILDFVTLADALRRREVPFELTLVGNFLEGDGTKDQFETRAAEHLAAGRIRFPGRLSRDEILAELSRHDFFVLLSDFEGLPLSLIEGMARGCIPVTAQMDSGIPDLIDPGANGFIVEGRDYAKWAALLADTWADRPRLAELSRQARATVDRAFTIEHVGAQFEELLTQVAREVAEGDYERPPSLNWGERSQTGDVLAPPNLQRPSLVKIAGLEA